MFILLYKFNSWILICKISKYFYPTKIRLLKKKKPEKIILVTIYWIRRTFDCSFYHDVSIFTCRIFILFEIVWNSHFRNLRAYSNKIQIWKSCLCKKFYLRRKCKEIFNNFVLFCCKIVAILQLPKHFVPFSMLQKIMYLFYKRKIQNERLRNIIHTLISYI